ncbi:MAG: A24 family peptidase [Burkholderiaceae bacterium]|nr:A24 family peptidase [Burkholderiaceae bacterium]
MLEALQQSPALAIGTAGVFGLLVGSFLNVVIHRLPKMLEHEWAQQAAELRGEPTGPAARFNLVVPRSQCPSCGHPIGALENIPLVSWLLQRGRCRACNAAIPARYPIVEGSTALLSAVAVAQFGWSVAALGAVVLTCFLITLAFIDFDTQLLPDSMTLPLLWIGLAFNLWEVFAPLHAAVVGALAGYLSLWSLYWLFKLATGKEGMGYGDFKLFAALGAWFGWSTLPSIILLASVVGAVVGIALMIVARHGREVPIPFGPYLAGAGLLALYFRGPLASFYGLG